MPAPPALALLRVCAPSATSFPLESPFESGQMVLLRSGKKPPERLFDIGSTACRLHQLLVERRVLALSLDCGFARRFQRFGYRNA